MGQVPPEGMLVFVAAGALPRRTGAEVRYYENGA
jgi:hypothetical protein